MNVNIKEVSLILLLLVGSSLYSCKEPELSNPPDNIILSNSKIIENDEAVSLIGLFNTTVSGGGELYTYKIVNENPFFSIKGNRLESLITFDYEERKNYDLRITVLDKLEQSFTKDFSIEVLDIDDNFLLGVWRYESGEEPYWYQLTFNDDLTGFRIDADGENDNFVYSYTHKLINFSSGFPKGQYTYKIKDNSLELFGDTLVRQ